MTLAKMTLGIFSKKMETDGEELDYDFDTPQKPVRGSGLASADRNKAQKSGEQSGGAAANANDDDDDAGKKRLNNDDDVEEELYGDIVSPGSAGGGGGGGAALLTLQVAEVRESG